ncbi:major histocompatibility complex class I-related gene protein-like isoform X3 [Salvelinus namaycush]|uniref:Major histocompatibility complex class I-related gene protein-like isoform X3 n=1 Tax=Salvelinus namaycush TaxID=8040 RepID=A0A8U1F5X9_SALNM|nr:major histocompatibility complex class I-related gene protein-like isoform X3 [Salvelinus namaycush]
MLGQILVLWVFLSLPTVSSVALKYFYRALSQSTGLPEFSAVAYLDEEPIYSYDSSTKEVVARQEWVKEAVDPDFWGRSTHILMETENVFKDNMNTARARFNQTSALVLQKLYKCEWDEETGATDGHEQYGYGGEDFLLFDMKNERWIAPVRQGLITKMKWDDNVKLKAKIHYLTHTCIEWLKKYVPYQRSMLERTGFYPKAIKIFWGRDGVEIHDDVVHEETLPNGDGTYQKRTHLTVSPEDLQKYNYTCTVQHIRGDDVVLSANRDSIRRNIRRHYNITITIFMVFVLVTLVIGVVVIKRKGWKGKDPTAGKEKQCPTSLPEKNVLLLNDAKPAEMEKPKMSHPADTLQCPNQDDWLRQIVQQKRYNFLKLFKSL